MSKIAETLKEQEEELSKFMIDEYGKWKIGRQEVTDIVNKYSTRIIEAVCEEKAVKIKEWKDKYNSNK